jgi:hypothetical protein
MVDSFRPGLKSKLAAAGRFNWCISQRNARGRLDPFCHRPYGEGGLGETPTATFGSARGFAAIRSMSGNGDGPGDDRCPLHPTTSGAPTPFGAEISAGNQHTNGSSTSTLNSRNGWHPARNQSDLGPVSFDADRKPRLFGARYQINRTGYGIYCAIVFGSCW